MPDAENFPPSQTSEVPGTPVLVSVIIPAFNASACIHRALDSVFAQTFSNYEVIVVNDGSPDADALETALQPYANRLRYLKQSNKGPGGARNAGILNMRGKYAAFLDSDDQWVPSHLHDQIRMLEDDPSLQLVYADSILTQDGKFVGHAFGREPQSPPVTFEKLLTEDCTVGTSSTVATRESLIAAGLFDDFRCCEDFDLWLRMAFRGAKMNYDPAVHVRHALSEGSLSGNRYVMKKARIKVYEKTLHTLPVSGEQRVLISRLIAETEAECQIDLLKEFLRSRNYERALDSAEKAFAAKPNWKLRMTILGLRTVPVIVRYYHRMHESFLSRRSRILARRSSQRFKNTEGLVRGNR